MTSKCDVLVYMPNAMSGGKPTMQITLDTLSEL